MENKKILEMKLGPIVYGLDIGMASVGWAVLAETRIVALGVRAFDKAETAKEGESLNLARRSARLEPVNSKSALRAHIKKKKIVLRPTPAWHRRGFAGVCR